MPAKSFSTVRKRFAQWPLTIAGYSALAIYLAWNAYWLCNFRIPPSLFLALTGLPCPTTGGMRSLDCLLHGEFVESLRFNAMALPICLLMAFSIAWLIACLVRQQKLRLPIWIGYGWVIVLALGWVLKLTGDPAYW